MRRILIICILALEVLSFSACSQKDEGQMDILSENEKAEQIIIITPTEAPQKSTDVEIGTGEGESAAELPDLTQYDEYKVGDNIVVKSGKNEYSFSIDSVKYIQPKNDHEEEPEKVILVTYTYTNHSKELLLLDTVNFQLMNEKKEELYEPYYFPDRVTSDAVGIDESYTAQVAFAQNSDVSDVVLIFQDYMNSDVKPILIRIESIVEGE